MFDMKKALKAALAVSPDRARRGEFAQFLLRLSDPSLPVSQWRTVGGTADMIERFLTELGFVRNDYELYVSRLDPSVRDFRWGTTGKYEALRTYVCETCLGTSLLNGNPEDVWLYRFAGALYAGTESPEELVDRLPGVVIGTDPGLVPERKRLPNVAELTRNRVREFGAAVALMEADLPNHPESDGFSKRHARARAVLNDVAADTNKGALPDLSAVEEIVRTLGLLEPEECPPFRVFDWDSPRYTHLRTVMRYLREGETVKGEEVLFGGLAPLDYLYSCDRNGDPNPLRGYLFQEAKTADKVDLSTRTKLFAMGIEALNIRGDDKFDVPEFASDAKRFWTYVRKLYQAFFGPDAKVAIHDKSRIAACNSGLAWSRYGATSFTTRCDSAMDKFGLDGNELLAVFGLVVSAEGCVRDRGKPESLPDTHPVRVRSLADSVDEADFASRGLTAVELAAEWYENVHRCNGPSYIHGYHGTHSQRSEESALRTFRSAVTLRKPSAKRLREEANYDTSKLLRPAMARYNCYEYSPVSAFVTGVGLLLRTDSDPDSNGDRPVRQDLEHAFWTGPDNGAHGTESYISAVYSGIDFPGSHFRKVMDAPSGDPNHPGVACMDDPDGWLAGALEHQLDVLPKGVAYGRVIAVETNVKWRPGFATSQKFWLRLRNLAIHTLCHSRTDPRTVMNVNPVEMEPYGWSRDIDRSFINGVTRQAYMSDVGQTAWLCNVEAAGRSVVARYFRDSRDRVTIVVGLYGFAERQAALLFRWSTGLPFVEAGTLARKLGGQTPFTFIANPEDRRSPEVAQAYWTCVLKNNRADNGNNYWNDVTSFGYGPWFRNVHRNDEAYAPAKADFVGAVLNPAQFIGG